jgi:ABC-type sugar transport system substrate-binding protein
MDRRGGRRVSVARGFTWLSALGMIAVLGLCGGWYGNQTARSAGLAMPAAAGVAQARQIVKQLEKPVTFKTPGPAIKVGNSLRGKTIYFLANGLNFPFVVNMLAGIREAAHLARMSVIAVDGAGDVAKAASLIEQGVGRRVDVIVDEGFPSSLLTTPIQQAKAAHIPFIEFGSGDPGLPPPSARSIGVSAWATYCYGCAGRQMADAAIAQSNGHVDAVIVNAPIVSVAQRETDGIVGELKRLCPATCKATVVDEDFAQRVTQLPSLTASSLQRDSNLNYFFPIFDSMVSLMAPTVTQLGAQNRVKFVTYNATQPAMLQLQQRQLVSADIGSPQHWIGWAIMDQAFRLLTHHAPLASERVPNRLFDAKNIQRINLNASEATWCGTVNFRNDYRQLWGK